MSSGAVPNFDDFAKQHAASGGIPTFDEFAKQQSAQPSALSRFGSGVYNATVGPVVQMATHPIDSAVGMAKQVIGVPELKAIGDAIHNGEYGKAALLVGKYATTSPADRQAAGIVQPIVDDARNGDWAGAAGRATGTAAMFAAPELAGRAAGAVADTAPVVALKAGVKAAAPDVLVGGTKVAAGQAVGAIPGVGMAARIALEYPGAKQIGAGITKGFKAGKAALAERAALAEAEAAPVQAAAPAPVAAAPPAPVSPGEALARSAGADWSKLSPTDQALMEHVAKAQENTVPAASALPPDVLAELTRDSGPPTTQGSSPVEPAPLPAGPVPVSPQPAVPVSGTPTIEGPQFPARNGSVPQQMPPGVAPETPTAQMLQEPTAGPVPEATPEIATRPAESTEHPNHTSNAQAQAERIAQALRKNGVTSQDAAETPFGYFTPAQIEKGATPGWSNLAEILGEKGISENAVPRIVAEMKRQEFDARAMPSRGMGGMKNYFVAPDTPTAEMLQQPVVPSNLQNLLGTPGDADALRAKFRAADSKPPMQPRSVDLPIAKSAQDAIVPQEPINATRETRGQSVSQEQAISESGGSGDSSRYGEASQVRVPGENRAYQARYALRELSEVKPSHNPATLQGNPEYAYSNDRNYSDPRNAERIVKQTAEFDPHYLISDSPDATNGAPVIDRNGNVLGGNSRTMTLARVYQGRPEAAAAYKALLTKKAGQFGLDPARVAGMKNPVLVRELTHELSPESAQPIITDLNKTGTATLTGAERAIADSNKISAATMSHMAGMIESQGPEGTLAKALEGKGGAFIADQLVKDGVITTQEKPGLFDSSGNITAAAKDRISKLMLGRVFRDSEQFEGTPPAVRNKLERTMAPLSRVAGKAEWDITPDMREAVDMLERARATGSKNLDDLVAQQGLFGGGEFSPRAVALAKTIQSKGPVELAKSFARYANDSKGPTMFGEVSAADAFSELTDTPQEPPAPKYQNKLKPPKE